MSFDVFEAVPFIPSRRYIQNGQREGIGGTGFLEASPFLVRSSLSRSEYSNFLEMFCTDGDLEDQELRKSTIMVT
jgi:hypothetical protein